MADNLVEYILNIKTKAAEGNLDNLQKDLDDIVKELQKVKTQGKKSFDKTKKSSDKAKESIKKTGKETKKTKKILTDLGRVRQVWGKVQFAIAGITATLGAVGVGFFKASQKVTDLTNELNDLSVRSGVSAKNIQALRQSLLASGQPASELNTILSGVSTRFATLSEKGSAVEKKFNSFGISVTDTSGKLKSNNEIMLEGIKKLQSIADSSERSRVAVLLFGKAGSKLNQALAAGNFENFLEFTNKFGIDTGPRASKSAAEFQVALSTLQTVMNGSLQRMVNLLDGQNKVTSSMIKLGSTTAFTIKLTEELTDIYSSLSREIRDLIDFALSPMVFLFQKPIQFSFFLVIKLLELMGIEIDTLKNKMLDFLGVTGDVTSSQSRLGKALNSAIKEADDYTKLVLGMGSSMDGLATSSINGGVQLDKLGKKAKTSKEEIRTLKDVIDDLLKKGGVKVFDSEKILGDLSIISQGISRSLKLNLAPFFDDLYMGFSTKMFNGLISFSNKIDSLPIPKLFTSTGWSKGIFQEMDSGFLKFFSKISEGFRGVIDGFAIRLNKVMSKSDFSKNIFNKLGNSFELISQKLGSSIGTSVSAGLTKALGVIGVILKVIEFAGKLGQMGDSQKEIQQNVEKNIRERARAIEIGLQVLPKILFETLPPLFLELADAIIFGFLKGIAKQTNMILSFFGSIFTREGRQENRRRRAQRVMEGAIEFNRRLDVLFGIASKRGGGFASARGGIRYTGETQGLTMLHPNEFVVPATQQMPQAISQTLGNNMGSNVTINVNAHVVENNAIDELVRQIERRFLTFGQSTSTLFGGR